MNVCLHMLWTLVLCGPPKSTLQQEEAFCNCLVSHVPLQAEATSRGNVTSKRSPSLQENIPVLCPQIKVGWSLCPGTLSEQGAGDSSLP